jgi:hypothetical protein
VPLLLPENLMSDTFFARLDPAIRQALQRAVVNGVFAGTSPESPQYRSFVAEFCAAQPQHCTCPRAASDCDKAAEGRVPAYVANAYDAVFIIALAIEHTAASAPSAIVRNGGWDIRRMSDSVLSVTNHDSAQDTPVGPGQWQLARQAIAGGSDLDYQGASASDLEFDAQGDPTSSLQVYWTLKDGRVVQTNSDGQEESYRELPAGARLAGLGISAR